MLPSKTIAVAGVAVAALVLSASAAQATITLTDTQRGGYSTLGSTGGSGTPTGNYLTGNVAGAIYRSQFVFNLAGISDPITSASITLTDDHGFGSGSPQAGLGLDAIVNLEVISQMHAGESVLNGLGASYGSVSVRTSTTHPVITITFNATGLADLNAYAGGVFILDAQLAGSPAANTFLFGSSPTDTLTKLTLETTPAALDAGVPEPASWALMLTGFGAMGAMLRRRRASFQAA